MKKIIIMISIIGLSYMFLNKSNAIEIPDEAIRLRVVANSDSEYDQNIKMKVSNVLQKRLYNLLKQTKNIEEARNIINNNLDIIDDDISYALKQENYSLGYKINFGKNYFPEKEFNGKKYDEGYYESVLVTLGEGKGKNWWCVLFPPLCIVEAEESDKVEYNFFLKEIFKKIF